MAKAAVKFSELSLKKLEKPIARLQSRKPAPSADDVSCRTPVQEGAVPLLTSAVALPERNSAQSLTTVAFISTEAWGKASSLVKEVVPDPTAPMPLLFLPMVFGDSDVHTSGAKR